MSVKELLIPRYKVIADYPNSTLKIGEIIEQIEVEEGQFLFNMEFFEKYPHLFRKLEWWEERDEKDMPHIISYISLTLKDKYGDDETKNRRYVLVESWSKRENGKWFYNGNQFNDIGKSFLPHTEEEYDNYLNSLP